MADLSKHSGGSGSDDAKPVTPARVKELAQKIDIARVKTHIRLRENLRADLIISLNDLFLTQNMRGFWQKAHLTGWLHRGDALKPMYNACQDFWYAHHAQFGHPEYMDVMRWKPTKEKIPFEDFVKQMITSYKASHAQQMRRWREKYADRLHGVNDLAL